MYVFCIDAVLSECVEEVDSDEEHLDGKLKIGHEHVQLDDETAGPSAVDTHDTEENVGYVCGESNQTQTVVLSLSVVGTKNSEL